MQFSDIQPFVRFARYLHIDENTLYEPHIPCDSRLFFAAEGMGQIRILGNTYQLKKGDVILIPSGIEYHLVNISPAVSYLAINFDYTSRHASLRTPIPPKPKRAFHPEDIIDPVVFDDISELNAVIHISNLPKIKKTLVQIQDEYVHRLILGDLKTSHLFSQVLIEIVRRMKLGFLTNRSTSRSGIEPNMIIDYIHENYQRELSNETIGQMFGYHPNYVNSLVKLYTGQSVHQYLMHIRIMRAASFLDSEAISVAEVAKKCGFSNIYYFSRCFKKKMGVPPSVYRST